MTFRIEHKIVLTIIMAVFLIMIIGYVAHRNLVDIDRRLKFVEAADDLSNIVLEMRRSEKNYFLYHEKDSLDEILDYVKKIDASVRAMEPEITRGMGESSFRAFMEHLQAYKNSMANMVNNHFSSKQGMELIRDEGRELYNFTKNVSQKQRRKIAALMGFSRRILFYSTWFTLIFGIIGGHFIAQRIVVPLKTIERTTRKISHGDFTPIPEVKTHDEIQSLTHAFNRMIKELRVREDQLVQSKKLASLGTLLSGVAHELNNPLSNISTSCQILLEEIEDSDLGFKKRYLIQMEEQTKKARNIVRSLLEFSREREFEKESLSLKTLIEETIHFIRGQIRPKVDLVVDVADEIIINADKQRIQQAFLNLVTNAIQAVGENGLVTITAKLNEEEHVLDIKFEDTGPGIKPDILPKVFDPFFTTKGVGEGSGLGLFITHQIIERHGGYITVESRLGEGTTFLVRLPLGEE